MRLTKTVKSTIVLELGNPKEGNLYTAEIEGVHYVFKLVELTKRNKKVRDLSNIAGRLKHHNAFSEGAVEYQRNIREN